MDLPHVVSREEWLAARKELLVKEKELTKACDAVNAQRRRLPMVRIDKEYVFEGPKGRATLLDLFEGRNQLIIDHAMWLCDFNYDFHVTVDERVAPIFLNYRDINELEQAGYHWSPSWRGDYPALSAFLCDGEDVYHTYSTYGRGTEQTGGTSYFLDLTALGRQEEWEEPKGRTTGLGMHIGEQRLYHDEYDT